MWSNYDLHTIKQEYWTTILTQIILYGPKHCKYLQLQADSLHFFFFFPNLAVNYTPSVPFPDIAVDTPQRLRRSLAREEQDIREQCAFYKPHRLKFAHRPWLQAECKQGSTAALQPHRSCLSLPRHRSSTVFFYFFISDFIPFSPNLVVNHTPISSITPPCYLDPLHTPLPWQPQLGSSDPESDMPSPSRILPSV